MNEYGGYLFIFDEAKRANMLAERAIEGWSFTDVMSGPDTRIKPVDYCFISFDGEEIAYAALVRRGNKVATAKYRVKYSNFIELQPISFAEIERNIDVKLRHHFIRSSIGVGDRVPSKTWAGLMTTVKRLRPESANALDGLERLRSSSTRSFNRQGFEIVAQEKDAVGLALEVFGANRFRTLSTWAPPINDAPAPFLQGLFDARVSEDTMINHDARVFSDWKFLRPLAVGAAEFTKGGEKLTIMNVNRQPVEHTLGVDLLYYHHRFQAYVMVQYKKMIDEGGKWVYRPTGKSYEAELTRMRSFEANHPSSVSIFSQTDGYRLHSRTFYFKLCPEITLNPLSTDLIKGMYIPLDYWELLIRSPQVVGPRGGIQITYENVGRHINNTLFIDLVQHGWIGSRSNETIDLTNIIRQSIENNHSVVIATSQSVS